LVPPILRVAPFATVKVPPVAERFKVKAPRSSVPAETERSPAVTVSLPASVLMPEPLTMMLP
jgi:hypothetical protein